MQIFLSYADADRKAAQELCSQLENAGFEVWHGTNIEPGENWFAAAARALEKSDAIVILLSPQALNSRTVPKEIDFVLSSPKFKDRVVTLQVKRTTEFPWILKHLPFVDASRSMKAAAQKVLKYLPKPVNAAQEA